MSTKKRKSLRVTVDEIEAVIGTKQETWAHNCHGVSLSIVQSGVFGPSRVARGWCRGVGGQHSWVILGMDCYDPDAQIIDATLWSYDETVEGVWTGTYGDGRHHPHGEGSIWQYGCPAPPTGKVIELTPLTPLSRRAADFLHMASPKGLDRTGWNVLAHAPVEGWPAAEIIAAMDNTPDLTHLVPIDILGMLTDRNPGGVYLRRAEVDA